MAFIEPLLKKAIELDPSFALARARLAVVKFRSYFCFESTDQEAEDARQQAEQSLRLQPDLTEGHLALGAYHLYVRGAYEAAVREFELARAGGQGEPLFLIAVVRWRQGRIEEALRNQQQAVRLDPRSPRILTTWADLLWCTRKYGEADQVLDRILLFEPDSFGAAIYKAQLREQWKGESEPVKNLLRQSRESRDRLMSLPSYIAGFLWQTRYPRESIALLDSVESDWIAGIYLGRAYLGLGRSRMRSGSCSARWSSLRFRRTQPLVASLSSSSPG